MKKAKFSFEDLEVWQKAVEFANRVIQLAEQIQTDRKHFRLIEQLEAASTSVALNIAEGKIFEEGVYSISLYCPWFSI